MTYALNSWITEHLLHIAYTVAQESKVLAEQKLTGRVANISSLMKHRDFRWQLFRCLQGSRWNDRTKEDTSTQNIANQWKNSKELTWQETIQLIFSLSYDKWLWKSSFCCCLALLCSHHPLVIVQLHLIAWPLMLNIIYRKFSTGTTFRTSWSSTFVPYYLQALFAKNLLSFTQNLSTDLRV